MNYSTHGRRIRHSIINVALACFTIHRAQAAEIFGRVTDFTTGLAIANASVDVSTPQFSPIYGQGTTTDSYGRYEIDLPFASSFQLDATADGYAPYRDFVSIPDTPALTYDIKMYRAASISGTIRGNGSQTLANINVSLLNASNEQSLQTVATDSTGAYRFNALAPGNYAACVFDPADIYVDSCYDGKPLSADGTIHFTAINVPIGKNVKNINLALIQGASISGILRDSFFGTPISNATMTMTLYEIANTPRYFVDVNTDVDGRYTLSGLVQGTYYVSAQYSGYSNSNYPETLHGSGECAGYELCTFSNAALIDVPASGVVNADIDLFPWNVLEGTVTDADTNMPLAGVVVRSENDGIATTDENGKYSLAHLPPYYGASPATTQAPGYIDQTWKGPPCYPYYCPYSGTGQGIAFSTPDQIVTGIDFALHRGATISGRITLADYPDVPIPNVYVVIFRQDYQLDLFQALWTDSNGEYHSDAWTDGTFYIEAEDLYGNCVIYPNIVCGDVDEGTPITLSPGEQRTGIDFQFSNDKIFYSGFE